MWRNRVDRAGIGRGDLQCRDYLVEGAFEVLGGPVGARHLEKSVLELGDVGVVVFAEGLERPKIG